MFKNRGFCPICEPEVEFSSEHEWFRDHYKCSGCGSIPRERALMAAIEMFYRLDVDFSVMDKLREFKQITN